MKKAIFLPMADGWCEPIFAGTKKYEFRSGNVKHFTKGQKIYFYESLGKKLTFESKGDQISSLIENKLSKREYELRKNQTHEGLGMVVGEATISNLYRIGVADRPFYDQNTTVSWSRKEKFTKEERESMGIPFDEGFHMWMPMDKSELEPYGWVDQEYAIGLTDVIRYGNPKAKESFTFYNKVISLEKLWDKIDDELCEYCPVTENGMRDRPAMTSSHTGCEGSWCPEAYEHYMDTEWCVYRAPMSFCYVVELED